MKKNKKNDLNILINRASNLEGNNRIVAMNLLNKLLFMEEVLNKLEKEIKENGVLDDFENGKQKFTRESQALKSYNNTIKNYQKILSEVSSLIPNYDEEFNPFD